MGNWVFLQERRGRPHVSAKEQWERQPPLWDKREGTGGCLTPTLLPKEDKLSHLGNCFAAVTLRSLLIKIRDAPGGKVTLGEVQALVALSLHICAQLLPEKTDQPRWPL